MIHKAMRGAQSREYKAGFVAALEHVKECFQLTKQFNATLNFDVYDPSAETPELYLIEKLRREYEKTIAELHQQENKLNK